MKKLTIALIMSLSAISFGAYAGPDEKEEKAEPIIIWPLSFPKPGPIRV
jgi:hypothetical protein